MERRFLAFMLLSLAVLTLWGQIVRRQRPPAAPDAVQQVAENQDAADDAVEADAGLPPGGDADDDDDPAIAAAGDAADDAPRGAAAERDDADSQPSVEYATLGSMDPASGYRMLVTFTNHGAGVRRIELSSPRYLDMQDRSGYLGNLEPDAGDEESGAVDEVRDPNNAGDGKNAALEQVEADNPPAGLLVRVVGPGTPAERAGLRVGDRIVAAGTKAPQDVRTSADLRELLSRTRPGNSFELVVERDGKRQTLVARLAHRPLEVVRPESENLQLADVPPPPGFVEPPSFLLTLESIGNRTIGANAEEIAGVELREANWKIVDRGVDSIAFARDVPRFGITVTKRYTLANAAADQRQDADTPAYHLTLEVTLENQAGGRPRSVAYRLDGPNGLPVEGWWYLAKVGRVNGVGLRDVLGRYFGAKPEQQSAIQIATGKAADFEGASLAYMGVDSQYFAVALIPDKQEDDETWTQAARPVLAGPPPEVSTGYQNFANVSCRLIGKPIELAPGERASQSYTVFAGPKRPELLVKYVAANNPGYTLGDFAYYGWFEPIAKAMLGILHMFYAIVRNYGVAIILLTVLVRACMFPVSRGQARSMARLQELRPEMEKLKEKYKGDQQKQAQAMQQLYRKHNVNPVAGCLPMFLQLPVFIGLWRGLAVDIELRQAPLLGSAVRWCSNLAAPDMLWNWSSVMPTAITSGQGIFGLGPYLNVLPLVTIGLFMLQQKMFMPPASTDQERMQQSIMKWMSIVISIMFYKVPSGLCLYLITSSLWGIAERKLVPPIKPAGLVDAASGNADVVKRATSASDGKSSGGGRGGRPAKSKRRR